MASEWQPFPLSPLLPRGGVLAGKKGLRHNNGMVHDGVFSELFSFSHHGSRDDRGKALPYSLHLGGLSFSRFFTFYDCVIWLSVIESWKRWGS
jgi:hypothetical protein